MRVGILKLKNIKISTILIKVKTIYPIVISAQGNLIECFFARKIMFLF